MTQPQVPQEVATQANPLATLLAQVERSYSSAQVTLKVHQDNAAQDMISGTALSVNSVERLFLQEQVVRAWRQVASLSATATGVDELVARLREWVADATEQVMSPGRSNSSSLVRTAQLHAEEDGLKHVAHGVVVIVRRVQR
jgi:hypothetical protein